METEDCAIPWTAVLSPAQNDGPEFICCKCLDRKVSPTAFLSVLCSTVRLQGTHLAHILNYQRSLTFPLLIGTVSANCRVVTCWISNDGHQLFLFQKQSFLLSSNQWCFCWPQHFHKHYKTFSVFLTLSQPHRILSQYVACITHRLTPLWGAAAVAL